MAYNACYTKNLYKDVMICIMMNILNKHVDVCSGIKQAPNKRQHHFSPEVCKTFFF